MVDQRIQSVCRYLDAINLYHPRIQGDVMKKSLEMAIQDGEFANLFKGDLYQMEFFYGFGRWYTSFATSYWFQHLTTREFVELICWANSQNSDRFWMLRSLKDMDSTKAIEKMRSTILDLRWWRADTLRETYGMESGVFTGDCETHFGNMVDTIILHDNLLYIPALYMMLAAVGTAPIPHIISGKPWLVKVPEHLNTWVCDFDTLSVEPLREIIAKESLG